MEVFYIPELYFDLVLIFGILSSVFILTDLFFFKKNLLKKTKLWLALFAVLLFWGPSLFIWIACELKYQSED